MVVYIWGTDPFRENEKFMGGFEMVVQRSQFSVLSRFKFLLTDYRLLITLASLLIAAFFLFIRLYNIQTSLLFFNDMGRDFLALLDWQETGKPPLLGPQTSAFSFNQSATYFYLLMPMYLLTGGSAFSSIYTVVVFYVLVLGGLGWYLYLHRRKLFPGFLLLCWLITLQPEIIRQNRFVWNPSFLVPFLVMAAYVLLTQKKLINKKAIILFSVSAASAVSFSYSAIPSVFAMLVVAFFMYRKEALKLFFGTFLAGILVNLPTLAFELRHNFVLTQLLIHGQTLQQTATSWIIKLDTLGKYLISSNQIISATTLILLVMAVYFSYRYFQNNQKIEQKRSLSISFSIFMFSLILILILPMNIESHYIFGILTLLLLTVAYLKKPWALLVTIWLSVWWLQPMQLQKYFQPARRTVSDLQSCYQQYCSTHPESLYVSMQSGILPYHNAPEHRYFMRQAGCRVLNIEETQDQSDTMAVVVDDSLYEHGKTAYNELTLFGTSEVADELNCQDNLQVFTLKRMRD